MKAGLAREGIGVGDRTYVLVFEPGEEVMEGLLSFAQHNNITSGHFTGIGAFSESVVAFFDMTSKEYLRIPVNEQVEVLALVGNIALYEGRPRIHAHVTLGRVDGTTCGGHLLEGRVRPTLEVVLTQLPELLRRERDEDTGLPLLAL
jgi:predicted DNA-binding protein with PD1-like motif